MYAGPQLQLRDPEVGSPEESRKSSQGRKELQLVQYRLVLVSTFSIKETN